MSPVELDLGQVERDFLRAAMRSRDHPRRPSWNRAGFRHGTRRQRDGQVWSVVAFTDDEGPAADVGVLTETVRFEVSGVRHTGTRGLVAGEANRDRREGVLLLSWLTDLEVATLVLDTDHGRQPATLWGDINAEEVRLFLAVVDDVDVTVERARHLDQDGAVLLVEDLGWVAFDDVEDDTGIARTADEIAEVLAEQDRIDASAGAVLRIELAEPED